MEHALGCDESHSYPVEEAVSRGRQVAAHVPNHFELMFGLQQFPALKASQHTKTATILVFTGICLFLNTYYVCFTLFMLRNIHY